MKIKLRGNSLIEQMYATQMPAPFLSVLTDDCIVRGRDYNAGGARYNNTYVQFVGLGSLTDSLSAVKEFCFDGVNKTGGAKESMSLGELLSALAVDFQDYEPLRQRLGRLDHGHLAATEAGRQ